MAMFQPDARSGARLAAALNGVHQVTSCASWPDFREALSGGGFEGALLDADHPTRSEALGRIHDLRRDFPDLALIGFTDRAAPEDFYLLGSSGLEGFVAASDGVIATRSATDEAIAARRGRVVARALTPHLPAPGPEAVGWALAHAATHPSVEDLARGLGSSLYALRKRLREARLPGPASLLVWGRLLAATARLNADGRRVEETAFALGYASAPAIARALRSHTGATPRELAERGITHLLERLVSDVSRTTSPPGFDPDITPTDATHPPRRP
jgi:AraC-like DNA-binding protein